MALQGGTYGGSILGCAAANATIDAIEEDGMLDNARDRGVQLVEVSIIHVTVWQGSDCERTQVKSMPPGRGNGRP